MKTIRACGVLMLIILIAGCSTKYIKVHNQKYRIGAAHGADLGAFGLARFEGDNLFERDGIINFEGIVLREETVMDVEEIKNIESKFSAEIKEIKNVGAKVEAGGKAESWEKVTYRLRSIEAKIEVVKKINQDKKCDAYKAFRDAKNARIITNILVGYGHNSSEKIEGKTDVKINAADIGSAEVDVTGNTTRKIKFSDGTILGYTYDRACWKHNEKSGEWEIVRFLTDNPSWLGDANCPDGQVLFPK